MAQTASVSQEMAREIAGINLVVADIGKGGEQVRTNATKLAEVADQLKALVGQFKI